MACHAFEDLLSKGFVQPDATFAGHLLGEFSALASVTISSPIPISLTSYFIMVWLCSARSSVTSKVDRTTPCVPLILAILARRSTTQLFVSSSTHCANATAQRNDGTTPLHRAFEQGHVDLARLLIEHGTDATAQSNDGTTPLPRASRRGHVDVAQFFIDHDTMCSQNPQEKTRHTGGYCECRIRAISPPGAHTSAHTKSPGASTLRSLLLSEHMLRWWCWGS